MCIHTYIPSFISSSPSSSFIGTRTTTRRLSQWFTNTSGSHIKFHQNTFTNGRECSGIFRSADFGADEHNVSIVPSGKGCVFPRGAVSLQPTPPFLLADSVYLLFFFLGAGYFQLHGHVAKCLQLLATPPARLPTTSWASSALPLPE